MEQLLLQKGRGVSSGAAPGRKATFFAKVISFPSVEFGGISAGFVADTRPDPAAGSGAGNADLRAERDGFASSSLCCPHNHRPACTVLHGEL